MILYHGSNTDIEQIDLKAGIPYKDFGQGFYLTPDIETAKRMAQKKVNHTDIGKQQQQYCRKDTWTHQSP